MKIVKISSLGCPSCILMNKVFNQIKEKLSNCKKDIMAFFKGRTLITQYGNYRSYKIGDIDFDRSVENTTFNICILSITI